MEFVKGDPSLREVLLYTRNKGQRQITILLFNGFAFPFMAL